MIISNLKMLKRLAVMSFVMLCLSFSNSSAQSSIIPEKISPVNLIKLNYEELEKLGVIVKSGSAEYIERHADESGNFNGNARKISISENLIQGKNHDPNEDPSLSTVYPRYVVYTHKSGTTSYFSRLDDYSNIRISSNRQKDATIPPDVYAEANNLVCVYFEMEEVSDKVKSISQVYLWYEPTPDFLQFLPDEYSLRLGEELQLENENSASGVERFTNTNSRTQFFENCSIYPNPVTNLTAVLKFTIAEDRMTSIAVYDLNGNIAKELDKDANSPKGENNINLELTGLADGMYIVVLITDNGESISQRIMVVSR